MKKNIYYTIKVTMGLAISFYISKIINIEFPISLAIIMILSLQETRMKSFKVSIKRFVVGNIAIILTFIIFYTWEFRLEGLIIMMAIFIPTALFLNAKSSIISGFVLGSHVLTLNELSWDVFFHENIILICGILIGFILMGHMPDKEKNLKEIKKSVEIDFRKVMYEMSYNLKNLCIIQETVDLYQLEKRIKKAKKLSYEHKENRILDKNNYYIDYFQMRLIQVYRLMYMEDHFRGIFVTQKQAILLSNMTSFIASIIGTDPKVEHLLLEIDKLRDEFKDQELPKTRLEFENRSVLFQYLNDLEEFVKIKKRYLEK